MPELRPISDRLREEIREQASEQERFHTLAAGAHDKPWWRAFMTMVTERRQNYFEVLATSTQDARFDDRLRGQITELSFFIALDEKVAADLRGTGKAKEE